MGFDTLKDVQWRVDYILRWPLSLSPSLYICSLFVNLSYFTLSCTHIHSSSVLNQVGAPSASLFLTTESVVLCVGGERKRETKDVCFEISDDKVRVLLSELETAKALMDALQI